ncbi:MAG: hypothetical protein WA691_04120 [Thermoplasmata archaeon]
MTDHPPDPVELETGEHTLGGWPVEMLGRRGARGVRGLLVLTTRRCLFFRQAGLFSGGKLVKPALFTARLDRIRTFSTREFSIPIGYGDRLEIPGIELDGREFKLNRETPSGPVLAEITSARHARLAESSGALR